MNTKGLFITFEGPEGSGKSTQVRRLVAHLQEVGHEVVCTREPGGTPTGELIRDILQHDKSGESLAPETEVLLFASSRAQLVHHVIIPALDTGIFVISDRFVDSTTAYQGYGRGFPVDDVLKINDFAIDKAIPDITFLLDIGVEVSMQRLHKRHQGGAQLDRIEREEHSFHEKVRHGYLELAKRWPERIYLLDGMRSEDELEEEIWGKVSSKIHHHHTTDDF
ncbi:MAG: dTMP kinase [Kiritimatiellae bacterium]|nr:dTMP kinase [Kiritimatiellia bacterium]